MKMPRIKNDHQHPMYLGVGETLTLIFLVLKLCNLIDWSWIWVLAPTWIPLSISGVCLIICRILEKITEKMTS